MDMNSGIVVVGVDQTPGSRAALDFALREGLAHGCTVDVVTAWQWNSPYEVLGHDATPEIAKAVAIGVQDAALQEALSRLDGRPVISQTVVHEYAAKVLVERADNASMLVVGSGRKNALSRALMGSVSEYCVRHSPAPVVVVPDPERVLHAPHADVAQPAMSGVRF
jgi:nucleotide-binding universal stress UspA family protein